MRAFTFAAGLLLAIAAMPLGSALLPACTDANATTSVNFTWTPGCLRIVSGDVITFDNADAAAHNARSSQDDNPVMRALGPLCFQTLNLGDGRTAQVRFTHDTAGVKASLRNANGSWGTPVDCRLAEEPTTLLSAEAGIPFECGIHASMTGRIVVAMLG